jgi:tetratricopeptide (TPR) repeat protein
MGGGKTTGSGRSRVRWLAPLLLIGVLALVIGGTQFWLSDAAEEQRLRRLPLPELERRAEAGQLDFRGAFVLASRLMDAGRLAEAEPLLRKLIEADRDHAEAYAKLGTLLARTGRQSEAFQVLTLAVNRLPDRVEPHLALADLYLSRHAWPQAIRELQAALRLDSSRDAAWYQLSSCYDELAQPARAQEAIERATRLAPKNDTYRVDLARLLWKQGDLNAARSHLRQALALNPTSVPAHYTLGEVLLSQPGATPADVDTAEAHLRKALRIAPGYPPARYQLGLAAMRRERWAEAAAEFEAALRIAPEFDEALFNLARAYDRLGRSADAERARRRHAQLSAREQQILDLRTRIGFGAEDPALYFRLARAYRDAGQIDRAYETYVSGLQRAPNDAAARAELAALAKYRPHPPAPGETRPHPPAPEGGRPHPPAPSPNSGRGGATATSNTGTPLPALGEGPGVRAVPHEGQAVRADPSQEPRAKSPEREQREPRARATRAPSASNASPKRERSEPLFTDITASAGIRFRYGFGGKSPLDLLEITAGGAGLLDVDGDGWLDLLLVGQQRCALYRNNRNGAFQEITPASGLPTAPPSPGGVWMGCAAGDIDDDGRVDLFLSGYPRGALYRNRGNGSFVEISRSSGIRPTGWTSSAAFADVDRDGRLDLYVGRYVRWGGKSLRYCVFDGVKTACGPEMYEPDQGTFYRNAGGGRFVDATRAFGLADTQGKTLGVGFADFNDDGWPDLYLANDQMPCDLYTNEKGRRLRNVSLASGTAFSRDGVRQGGMGVDWGDFDGDGRLDLFVTTFYQQPKSLYRNEGRGLFSEVSDRAGLLPPTLPYVAFGTRFFDLDNDGLLDLFIANGHVRDNPERLDPGVSYPQPMQLFRNTGGGRFEDLSRRAGPAFEKPIVGRAAAFGDIDNDGDTDLLVVDAAGAPLLLRNEVGNRHRWLTVRVVTGSPTSPSRPLRDAIGAHLTLWTDGRRQIAEVMPGASYLATNDPRVHFGLGGADRVDRLKIRWPDGRTEEHRNIAANQFLTLRQTR